MQEPREGGLLAWQWRGYPDYHHDRRNLAVHVLTVPWFIAGTCSVLLAPVLGFRYGVAGAVAMIAAVALQGRMHAIEATPPLPFRGPADGVARLFAEQWISFPRFVASGGFARAWREAARRA
jgi:hypothetical protein